MSRKEIQLRDILQALHWILQNILHCFLESYAKRPQPALITLYPVYYRITPILKNFSTNLEPKVGLDFQDFICVVYRSLKGNLTGHELQE